MNILLKKQKKINASFSAAIYRVLLTLRQAVRSVHAVLTLCHFAPMRCLNLKRFQPDILLLVTEPMKSIKKILSLKYNRRER